MQLFSCTIRLNGEIANEVAKVRVTPAEIAVLRAIHGGDAVVKIRKTGTVNRSDASERDRLSAIYSKAVCKDDDERKALSVLGTEFSALPATVPGLDMKQPEIADLTA